MQNLERCIINFFNWTKNLDKPDDHIWHDKNEIKIEYIWFYKVSKYMCSLIIILKAIKYKKNFFYYLSSYLNPGLQIACF